MFVHFAPFVKKTLSRYVINVKKDYETRVCSNAVFLKYVYRCPEKNVDVHRGPQFVPLLSEYLSNPFMNPKAR